MSSHRTLLLTSQGNSCPRSPQQGIAVDNSILTLVQTTKLKVRRTTRSRRSTDSRCRQQRLRVCASSNRSIVGVQAASRVVVAVEEPQETHRPIQLPSRKTNQTKSMTNLWERPIKTQDRSLRLLSLLARETSRTTSKGHLSSSRTETAIVAEATTSLEATMRRIRSGRSRTTLRMIKRSTFDSLLCTHLNHNTLFKFLPRRHTTTKSNTS